MNNPLSGIADEAGSALETQIAAHRELGWKFIELRGVNGRQFTDASDEEFAAICEQLAAADLRISSYASAIANGASKLSDPFEKSVETLARVIPRMRKTGTQFIRVMSYSNDGRSDADWHQESVRRLRELGKMAEAGGITLVVENCSGWASTSAENYSRFFEEIDSPAVKAVYDTGNPASHGHTNTWEWYQAAKPHLAYVHIKAHSGPGGEHQWPDEGHSCIRETLLDLKASGYAGFISIEPHIGGRRPADETRNRSAAFVSYVEYGRRLTTLVESL